MVDCPVYRAERLAWPKHPAFTAIVPDAQAFVTWVTEREPFLSLRAKGLRARSSNTVTVAYGVRHQKCSLAYLSEQHVALGFGTAATQGLLLHEIAHLCSPLDAHHDHRYVANYLKLVETWLGSSAAEVLLRALRETKAFP